MNSKRSLSFLAVGFMKCGTTTIYRDLEGLDHVRMLQKDTETLLQPDFVPKAYLAQFDRNAVAGDFSTEYGKPENLARALSNAPSVIDDQTVLIIATRDPVRRAISHYHHDLVRGETELPPEAALHPDSQYVRQSDYASLVRPWLDIFPMSRVYLVQFERYMSNRSEGLEALARAIGLPDDSVTSGPTAIYNVTANKGSVGPVLQRITDSLIYRRWVRPALTPAHREQLRRLLAGGGRTRNLPEPSSELITALERALRDSAIELGEVFDTVNLELWPSSK